MPKRNGEVSGGAMTETCHLRLPFPRKCPLQVSPVLTVQQYSSTAEHSSVWYKYCFVSYPFMYHTTAFICSLKVVVVLLCCLLAAAAAVLLCCQQMSSEYFLFRHTHSSMSLKSAGCHRTLAVDNLVDTQQQTHNIVE